jgi:hypothetical protein
LVQWALIALALAAAAFFVSSTLRGKLLAAGLELGARNLPGVWTVQEMSWPRLDHVRLDGVVWSDGSEPSARAVEVTRLEAWVDLGALRSGDVWLDSLQAVVPWVDAPVIARTLTAWTASRPDTALTGPEPRGGLLRAGALPGLPSLAVANWQLEIATVVVSPEISLTGLRGTGGLEAGHGHQLQLTVDDLAVDVVTTAGRTTAGQPLTLALSGLGLGASLNVAAEGGEADRIVDATLDSLRVNFTLPGASLWQDRLPAGFPHEQFGPVSGRLWMAGTATADTGRVALDLDLAETAWLDTGRLKVRWLGSLPALRAGHPTKATVELDTLALAAMGSVVHASGTLRDGDLALVLQAAVPDARLARLFRPALTPQTKMAMAMDVRADGPWRRPAVSINLGGDWQTPELQVPRLRLEAQVDTTGGTLRLDLPAGLRTAEVELDSLAARITVSRTETDSLAGGFVLAGRRGRDRLHCSGFAWLDSLTLNTDGRVSLDSLAATIDGHRFRVDEPIRLSRAGGVIRGAYDGALDLPGPALLKPLLPAGFQWDESRPLLGRVTLAAAYQAPRLSADFDLDLGQTTWLDQGLLRGRFDCDVAELQAGRYDQVAVKLDTMELGLLGTSLQAAGRLEEGVADFGFKVVAADRRLVALLRPDLMVDTEFDLAGTGRVRGPLVAPAIEVDLAGAVAAPAFRTPRLSLQLSAAADSATVTLSLPQGIAVGGGVIDSLSVWLQGRRAVGDSVSGTFRVAARRGPDFLAFGGSGWADHLGPGNSKRVRLDSLVTGSEGKVMRLEQPATLVLGPGRWDVALTPLRFEGASGAVSIGGRADTTGLNLVAEAALTLSGDLLSLLLPGRIWTEEGGNNLSLDLAADLNGTRAAPQLGGRVSLRLISRAGDSPLGADLDFSVSPADTAGLHASLDIVAADSVVVAGTVTVPGHVDPVSGRWQRSSGRPARVVIPAQTVRLAPFARLLPPNLSVIGPVTVAAELEFPLTGMVRDSGSTLAAADETPAKVKGQLKAPRLEVRLPNRSRIDLGLDLKLSGPTGDPTVGGRIVVHSGFIRIPEIPRYLHATDGTPALWLLAAPDTVAGTVVEPEVYVRPETVGPVLQVGNARPLPQFALEVDIPGNLRVYGYGLEAELAGELKIDRGYDRKKVAQPRIQGTVNTVQGTLKFMNRLFHLESGEIRFLGTVPADPQLDLVLETTVSGTLVSILVTGPASNLLIEMKSEPDYDEADIMAVLLFGRTLGELDSEQRGEVTTEASATQQLRQNLAGLAMMFGTSGLQKGVSNRVGVDMIEVGSDSRGDNTLMLGTYLNPRLMLKYHQSLEKSGTYFVTIEYTLTRLFRLVSAFGQGGESSGLELKWSRRY